MILSWLPLMGAFDDGWQGDTSIYRDDSNAILQGKAPYQQVTIEYPPYAIPIFLAPQIFGSSGYLDGFKFLAACCDIVIRGLLFWIGTRQFGGVRRWAPLVCYVTAIPFLRDFLLQRYDLWPSLICLGVVFSFCKKKFGLSGFLIALGIGVKVYPALFALPLLILAWRVGRAKRFSVGLSAGLAPMVLLAFLMPWWRFAALQGARGLQAESFFASLVWGLHRIGLADANWIYVFRWFEVQGPLASLVLPLARLIFVVALVVSACVCCLAANRLQSLSVGRLARLLLVPLLAFVAFNQVLSPQFMIWLLPLAGLATLEGNYWPPLAVVLATMLTPIIFPSFGDDYSRGLKGWETLILIIRNLTLAGAWIILLVEHWRIGRAKIVETTKPDAVASV
jgi:hypothetical protein